MAGESAAGTYHSSLFTLHFPGLRPGAQAPVQALHRPTTHALRHQRRLPHAGHRAAERRTASRHTRRRHTDHRDHPLRAGQLEPRLQRRRARRPATLQALQQAPVAWHSIIYARKVCWFEYYCLFLQR